MNRLCIMSYEVPLSVKILLQQCLWCTNDVVSTYDVDSSSKCRHQCNLISLKRAQKFYQPWKITTKTFSHYSWFKTTPTPSWLNDGSTSVINFAIIIILINSYYCQWAGQVLQDVLDGVESDMWSLVWYKGTLWVQMKEAYHHFNIRARPNQTIIGITSILYYFMINPTEASFKLDCLQF